MKKYWIEESLFCRNCNTPLPEGANYCPVCSQRNTTGKVNVWEFAKDAFSNLFNLDSKLFKTAAGLFIPGKLTAEFFEGKHKSYASPVRMFLVSAIFFFTMVGFQVNQIETQDNFFFGSNDNLTYREKMKVLDDLKSWADSEVQTPEDSAKIAFAYEKMSDKKQFGTGYTNITTFGKEVRVTNEDIQTLTVDSLLKKYEVEDVFEQHLFRQFFKMRRDSKSVTTTLISNMTWMLLLMIPFIALIFKLLYIRRNRYYVEHLVFLFHFHAFALLYGTAIIIFYEQIPTLGMVGLGGVMLVYLLLSMKKIYQQNWWKTIVKFLIVFFSYMVFLILFFALTAVVSAMIF